MDGETFEKLRAWLGFDPCDSEDSDVHLILWHVAERLEQEGWSVYPIEDKNRCKTGEWSAGRTKPLIMLGFFPTKREAVEAAFIAQTKEKPRGE